MKKQIIFGVLVVLIIVSMIGVISAEMLTSDVGVEYESEILREFNKTNQTLVGVFFELKDMSEADNLFSDLTESDFEFVRKSSKRIIGKVTKKGFDKLINDERIKVIYFSESVYATNDKNETQIEENISNKEEKEFEINLWLIGIFILVALLIIYLIFHKKE